MSSNSEPNLWIAVKPSKSSDELKNWMLYLISVRPVVVDLEHTPPLEDLESTFRPPIRIARGD
jgi:hypothetical protein